MLRPSADWGQPFVSGQQESFSYLTYQEVTTTKEHKALFTMILYTSLLYSI